MTTFQQRGFSLIELMVTVAILAIVVGIAIPTYSSYKQRANRQDATRNLSVAAQALERCYSQNFAYTGTNCSTVAGSTTSSGGFYTITTTITAATATVPASYTLTAVALKAPQLTDTTCATFSLDSTGLQKSLNSGSVVTTATCWGST